MVNAESAGWIVRGSRAARVLLLAAALLTVVWTLRTHAPTDGGDAVTDAASTSIATAEESLKPLNWYEPLLRRDLRQPPVPANAHDPVLQPPPAELPELLGTFVERGRAFAHLRTRQGRTRICGVSDTIDAFEVAGVETGRALLVRGDQKHWLALPQRIPKEKH
jgi:hypothetical protein